MAKYLIYYLGQNKIDNIESLATIKFDSLTVLGFDNNNISLINCIKKISCPLIQVLLLYENPISKIDSLQMAKMNNKSTIR